MNGELGEILKTDRCPEKNCEKGGIMKDCVIVDIVMAIISVVSGNMLIKGGVGFAATVAFELVFLVAVYTAVYYIMKGSRNRLAETFINICEKGICGIRAINGYKNGDFSVAFSDIKKVTNRGERVIIHTETQKIVMILTDAKETVSMIYTMIENNRV